MRRSRSLSAASAEARALRRLSNSSLAASIVSWSACSSTNQCCHSPGFPSSRIGASSDTSPARRRFMSTTSCSVTPRRLAMSFTWSGRRSPSFRAEILLLALQRLKKSFFWLAVVPIFTRDHERRNIIGDPRPAVSAYVSRRKIDEGPYPSLSVLIQDIAKQVAEYGSLARIPAAAVGNTRNDMYLASEAIRFLMKDKENDLSKEEVAKLAAYKASLDNATKFIPLWVKVA